MAYMNTVMVWAAFLCWFLMSMFTAFLATVAFQARSGCGLMEFKGILSVPLTSSNLSQRNDLCPLN